MKEATADKRPAWRLVVSDMDGTLLDSRSMILPENARAIARLNSHGIAFTLATGRMDRMVRAYVRQLDVQLPIIACNGAVIRDCKTDEIIWQQVLPADQAMDMISWLQSHAYDYLCYTPDHVFFPAHSRRVGLFHRYNQMAAAAGSETVALYPIEGREAEAVASGLIKILAVPDGQDSLAALSGSVSSMPGLDGVASMQDAYDIMASGVSKGNALVRLVTSLGLKLEEVVAVGDNDNDASMLTAAGLGIAMANATPRALAACQAVTAADHNHGGLAEAINKFII